MYINNELKDSIAIFGTGSWSSYQEFSQLITIEESNLTASVKLVMHVDDDETYIGNMLSLSYEWFSDDNTSVPSSNASAFVSVYPNCVTNTLHVNLMSSLPCGYLLYDMNGVEQLSGTLNEALNSIDLTSLNAGVYFLRVNGQAQSKVQKIVKS